MKYFKYFIILAISPLMAFAHSDMQTTTPAHGEILTEVPAEIALNFTDKMRLTTVKARHSEGETQDIDLDGYKSFAMEFMLPIQPMGAGRYDVEWRGLGTDGHAMQGEFSFEVE